MQAIIFDLDETVFTGEGILHEGVRDLLDILRRLGVKRGALTDGDHRMLVRLEEAGIRDHFDGVLCSEHMPAPKDPVGVQQLLDILGADARQAALVSYRHSDIVLGRHSGVAKTIRVTHGNITGHVVEADHVVENIPAVLDVLE